MISIFKTNVSLIFFSIWWENENVGMAMHRCSLQHSEITINNLWFELFKKNGKTEKSLKTLDDKQRLVVSWLEQGKRHHVIYLIMTWNMFPCSMFVQYFLFLTSVLASTLKRMLWSWLFYFRWNTGLELSDNCLCSWQLWSCIFIFTFFPQMQLGASCPDKQQATVKKKTAQNEL